jgi:hypothetical protein
MDFVIFHWESWTNTQIEELVLSCFYDFINAPQRIIQLIWITPAIFVEHSIMIYYSIWARRWPPRNEWAEQYSGGDVVTVRHQLVCRISYTAPLARCGPLAEFGVRIQTSVENSDAQVRVNRSLARQGRWI